ncbi:c-type cytochrome [Tenacibaculum maritimum]|uniref:c-type cytochrome n=1 Tax=Tenacibaculum maritimum TaxID=107401 RepID=UPI0012E5333C|nr:cytochrome c [Tenacibaculum maritimum]MCD9581371.1 cytochrome c [Tenacibaculum maritimum]MCD9635676.1 cytochrome c [Tenacibaculum maritimum]CAA0171657.1 Quinol:cytochrome c oxidoreductase monoheme cytochrome subunit [Tenacibaculum maritimum]CAA0187517.1 Quinol:cytochrome c oxidoreductase monoheme cytochrome subunit [Tenacibaculum maritimum]CAA0239929.1 Quinol:cytochrome c oxidoreductase monoheme cytochrome subunit [Tenacibaculum maritimum]
MKNFVKIIIALVVVTSVISCADKRKPQVQYMPDMYVSVPYDANGANGINGKMVDRDPVAGTIKRGGYVAFEYLDTNEGYELAKTELKNPLKLTEENLENGKKMYGIYCAVCHGKKGDGAGILSKRDKFNGIPNYKDRDITEGSIYYVIMYGRNLMGSHASQLTTKERWQVTQYVEKLRKDLK